MKNEENDILKMMAMQAKLRMKNGAYRSSGNKKTYSPVRGLKMYVSNFSADYRLMAMSTKEDERLLEKVREILKEEKDVLNPIDHLIDKTRYNLMDDVEKMRYVLGVSEKYRNYVEQCQKEII